MPYQLVKFICKYCGREYKLEKNAEEHEKKCYHNEANRACVTCGTPIDECMIIHLLTVNQKDIQHWEDELDHATTQEAKDNAEINLYRHMARQYVLMGFMECAPCLQK